MSDTRGPETWVTESWTIAGRVQGVGYRDWMVREALRLGVAGWVRNRGPDDVEALVQGSGEAVARLYEACLRGPRSASVASIERHAAGDSPVTGFERRASR